MKSGIFDEHQLPLRAHLERFEAAGRQVVQPLPEDRAGEAVTVQGGSGLTVPLSDPNDR